MSVQVLLHFAELLVLEESRKQEERLVACCLNHFGALAGTKARKAKGTLTFQRPDARYSWANRAPLSCTMHSCRGVQSGDLLKRQFKLQVEVNVRAVSGFCLHLKHELMLWPEFLSFQLARAQCFCLGGSPGVIGTSPWLGLLSSLISVAACDRCCLCLQMP